MPFFSILLRVREKFREESDKRHILYLLEFLDEKTQKQQLEQFCKSYSWGLSIIAEDEEKYRVALRSGHLFDIPKNKMGFPSNGTIFESTHGRGKRKFKTWVQISIIILITLLVSTFLVCVISGTI